MPRASRWMLKRMPCGYINGGTAGLAPGSAGGGGVKVKEGKGSGFI